MTKKKNDPKPKAAATLAERLRKLAAELDVATGEAPERISDEAAIAAHVVEITRPGSCHPLPPRGIVTGTGPFGDLPCTRKRQPDRAFCPR